VIAQLVALIEQRRTSAGRPIFVGISGYCGAGKSTLARRLTNQVRGTYRLRGDDFLDPVRSHKRSSNWDGVERLRLVSEIIQPVREGRRSTFRRYDWSTHSLGEAESLPAADIFLIDAIGLFHPDVLPLLDLTLWCDIDLETAAKRGMARDVDRGREHERLWRDVWIPNDREFDARFGPRDRAEVLVPTLSESR
jgi:uridine kinase